MNSPPIQRLLTTGGVDRCIHCAKGGKTRRTSGFADLRSRVLVVSYLRRISFDCLTIFTICAYNEIILKERHGQCAAFEAGQYLRFPLGSWNVQSSITISDTSSFRTNWFLVQSKGHKGLPLVPSYSI